MMSAKYCPRVSPSVRGCPRVSTKFCSRNTVCQIANILQVTSWLVELFQAKCCLQNDVRKILSASVRGCPPVSAKFCSWNTVRQIANIRQVTSWLVELFQANAVCKTMSAKYCPRVSASVRECPWVSAKFCPWNTVCQIANILQVTSWLVELFQAKCCLQNYVRKILSASVPECPWVSASVHEILFRKYSLSNCKYSLSDKLISWTISSEMLSAKWCPQNTVRECPWVSASVHEILFTKYCLPNSSDKLISWTISREMLSAKWCPQNTVHECPRVSVGVRECPRNFFNEILSA